MTRAVKAREAVKPTFAGRILDSLIAATAAEHGLIVATRNVPDFKALGVEVVNPWAAVIR